MLGVSMKRLICRFRPGTSVLKNLFGKKPANQNKTLQNQLELVYRTRRLKLNSLKRNVLREIDSGYLMKIPLPLTAEFYKSLREKLNINGQIRHLNATAATELHESSQNLVNVLAANGDATEENVIKLFEKQFKIEWHTTTGDPDQFGFYGFCDHVRAQVGAGSEDVTTYNTRRAHVVSRLYHARDKLHQIRHLSLPAAMSPVVCTYRELCQLDVGEMDM